MTQKMLGIIPQGGEGLEMGKITRRLFCYAKSWQYILLFSSRFQFRLYVCT